MPDAPPPRLPSAAVWPHAAAQLGAPAAAAPRPQLKPGIGQLAALVWGQQQRGLQQPNRTSAGFRRSHGHGANDAGLAK